MLSSLTHEELFGLGRQRWLVPLLAQFNARPGWRFAELLHRLGAPRDSLTRTLEAALKAGWIRRNPGHGHPLRPEYILAEPGRELARVSAGLSATMAEFGLLPSDLNRWSLPVLVALRSGDERFNEIERRLAQATPRALSQTLRALAVSDLIDREVENSYPPGTRYSLTARGARMVG